MNWNSFVQILLTILASLGGATVIAVAIIVWIGKILENTISIKFTAQQNRGLEALKNEYGVELERLRADISRQRDALSNITSAITSGYMATHPHIVNAIDDLWSNILEIDELSSTYLLVHNVLSGDQIEQLNSEYAAREIHFSRHEFDTLRLKLAKKSETKRPFVGEKLWTLFYVYRAFSLRICIKMHISQERSGRLYAWHKDDEGNLDTFMLDILRVSLTEDELNYVTNIEIGASSEITNLLKGKILSEMNELVFGKRMLNMSIEEQQKRVAVFSRS